MIEMMAVGALIGAALYALLVRVAPPAQAPAAMLARLDRVWTQPRETTAVAGHDSAPVGVMERVGSLITAEGRRRGWRWTSLQQDLALTGRTLEAAMGRKVIFGCAGLVLALLLAVGARSVGIPFPAASALVLAGAFALAGFYLPNSEARSQARKRRIDFRHALGAYLDLVALEMAGSAAPAEALPSAAKVGGGWPLVLIRRTLFQATRAGRDQWKALAELGERIGVDELRELGELVAMVAHDGSRVRSTLTARAATMRQHDLADMAGQAGKQDSSMRVAQVIVGFGFILFLIYPAMATLQGL